MYLNHIINSSIKETNTNILYLKITKLTNKLNKIKIKIFEKNKIIKFKEFNIKNLNTKINNLNITIKDLKNINEKLEYETKKYKHLFIIFFIIFINYIKFFNSSFINKN